MSDEGLVIVGTVMAFSGLIGSKLEFLLGLLNPEEEIKAGEFISFLFFAIAGLAIAITGLARM